ncbi:response regulator transcription factor [Actinosynnema sp. CA-299493]
MRTILLVDDDEAIRAALTRALTGLRYDVTAVGTAAEALRETARRDLDLVLLDLGLPDLHGAATLRMIRGVSTVPVIVITARRDEHSIVQLLDAGADDYLSKPFSIEHLTARMRALLRRTTQYSTAPDECSISVGDLHIDLLEHTASVAGVELNLAKREFDLLAYLAERPNKVVTRRELLEHVWGESDKGGDRTIDVHLSWLRRKLGETAARPRYLRTVRGIGVKLVPPL